MIINAKYNKCACNLLKFILYFLLYGSFVYGNAASYVAANDQIFAGDDTSLLVSTNEGLSLFKEGSWKFLPGKYLVSIDKLNTVYVADKSFIGKIRHDQHILSVDTLFSEKTTVSWEIPLHLYSVRQYTYIITKRSVFLVQPNALQLIDSSENEITVVPGDIFLFLLKFNGMVVVDGSQKKFLPDYYIDAQVPAIKFKELITIHPPKKSMFFRWWAWTLYAFALVGVVILYLLKRRHDFETEKAKLEQIIQERTAELMQEKEKTDELLANLLPKDTADELKNTGKATSHKFNMVTVLFSDIQGFTKIAEQMNPEKLIDELDNFFLYFDSVVDKYNIEKIKTIGDAYMCAGGIPYKNRTNPVEVVLAAIEIQEYMRQLKLKNNHIWDLRIGIHTGAVIAGVVGHKRMSYDIWGDTVNTASRMESSGEPGKVNVSGQTYEMIKDFFICEYRGRMPVKYKGDVDMYFVRGIRPELSVDLKKIPSKRFFIQLQMLRLIDLEEFVMEKLTNELPPHMYFHNERHTREVYTQVELLGRAENISQEEMLLLRTASLLLNMGYIRSFENPENESVNFARDILPKYKYTKEQTEAICSLIYSVRYIENIKSKTEAILIDAYLAYFGRIDFLEHSKNNYLEVKERVPSLTEKEWFYHELHKVERFKFYSSTAKMLREFTVEQQVQKIKEYANL